MIPSVVAVTLLALPVPIRDDCGGDPGFVLEMPDHVAIGAGIRITMQGPADEMGLLMVSLGQGPTETKYGTICLDFPLLTSVLFELDSSGRAVLESTIPFDPGAIGIVLYAQFITGKPQRGLSNQDSTTITDGLQAGDLLTFTQDSWGTQCEEGDGAGCILDEWFATIFPDGLTIGDQDGEDEDDDRSAHFTSASTIETFLPADGEAGLLTEDSSDPTTTSAGTFAGELAAARFNVALDDSGVFDEVKGRPDVKLGDLIFISGVNPDILGFRVRDFLDICDLAISGALGDGDIDIDGDGEADSTIPDLSGALKALNGAFQDGTINRGTIGFA